jgi:hypothetical protein
MKKLLDQSNISMKSWLSWMQHQNIPQQKQLQKISS